MKYRKTKSASLYNTPAFARSTTSVIRFSWITLVNPFKLVFLFERQTSIPYNKFPVKLPKCQKKLAMWLLFKEHKSNVPEDVA